MHVFITLLNNGPQRAFDTYAPSKKKQEPKDDNDDDAEKPEPVIIETMIDGHPFIVQELVFGVPAHSMWLVVLAL